MFAKRFIPLLEAPLISLWPNSNRERKVKIWFSSAWYNWVCVFMCMCVCFLRLYNAPMCCGRWVTFSLILNPYAQSFHLVPELRKSLVTLASHVAQFEMAQGHVVVIFLLVFALLMRDFLLRRFRLSHYVMTIIAHDAIVYSRHRVTHAKVRP